MSDSVQPHRRQLTRLPCPWDSPGKNTGVGCHFLLQCMKVKSENEVTQLCLTLHDPMDCSPPGSSVHGIFQARVLEWVGYLPLNEKNQRTTRWPFSGSVREAGAPRIQWIPKWIPDILCQVCFSVFLGKQAFLQIGRASCRERV